MRRSGLLTSASVLSKEFVPQLSGEGPRKMEAPKRIAMIADTEQALVKV
jgi:hypothetical protein